MYFDTNKNLDIIYNTHYLPFEYKGLAPSTSHKESEIPKQISEVISQP